MKFIVVVCSTFILSLSGCIQAYYLYPKTENIANVDLFMMDGKDLAISHMEKSTVTIFADKRVKNEIFLYLRYQNDSEEPINIFPSNIKVSGVSEYGKPIILSLYSPEEYIKRLQRKQEFQLAIGGLSEVFESINAGNSYSKSTGTIGEESISVKTESMDYTQKYVVERENRKQDDIKRQQYRQQNSGTLNGLIKRNTLLPGHYIEGSVIVKYQFSNSYLIDIPIGNEHHIVEFVRMNEN